MAEIVTVAVCEKSYPNEPNGVPDYVYHFVHGDTAAGDKLFARLEQQQETGILCGQIVARREFNPAVLFPLSLFHARDGEIHSTALDPMTRQRLFPSQIDKLKHGKR